MKDMYIVSKAYGSTPQMARWNASADAHGDSTIDVKDTYIVVKHFGEIRIKPERNCSNSVLQEYV